MNYNNSENSPKKLFAETSKMNNHLKTPYEN